MGLAERRAAKDFETKRFPSLKSEIDAAAGFAPELEVAWDKLALDGEAHLYDEAWEQVYFRPLIAAIAAVTVDDMGKEALRAGLRRIAVTNEKGNYSGDAMASFAGGVLALDHLPTSNIGDVDERARAIQKVLEAGL